LVFLVGPKAESLAKVFLMEALHFSSCLELTIVTCYQKVRFAAGLSSFYLSNGKLESGCQASRSSPIDARATREDGSGRAIQQRVELQHGPSDDPPKTKRALND
jgi:hypothetical protein